MKTVFLDRDGIINQCIGIHQYVASWKQFRILPGVEAGIRKLKEAGYQVIIVTNQQGIARGLVSKKDVDAIHNRLMAHIEQAGGKIDGIYVCPHKDGTCDCRKPQIGLFLQAEQDFSIDKEHSWMVGDSETDVEAGKRYGVRTILTHSLPEAVEQILQRENEMDIAERE